MLNFHDKLNVFIASKESDLCAEVYKAATSGLGNDHLISRVLSVAHNVNSLQSLRKLTHTQTILLEEFINSL